MTVRVRRGREQLAHTGERVAPLNGVAPFRFEVGTDRDWFYGDTPGEMLAAVVGGYPLKESWQEQLRARIRHALIVATNVQGQLLAAAAGQSLGKDAQEVLRQAPHRVTAPRWDAPVALVLLDVHYRPFGAQGPPEAVNGPLWWLRPSEEYVYLQSLAEMGQLTLAEHP